MGLFSEQMSQVASKTSADSKSARPDGQDAQTKRQNILNTPPERLRCLRRTSVLEIGLDRFTLLLQPHPELYQEYTQIMSYPPA